MYESHMVSAILTCAGKGTRFGSNKLLAELDGMTVLERTARAFVLDEVDEVIVTMDPSNERIYQEILIARADLPVTLVPGGELRHISAMNGLAAASGDIIVIHDGVRPFVTADLIVRAIDGAIRHGAAMLGMPSTVQVKLVDDSGLVEGSLDRAHSWLGQTPQAFRRELIESAYAMAMAGDFRRVSDDAEMVAEFTDSQVRMLEGHVNNIKITTRQDLGTAQMIVRHLIDD